MMNRYGLDSVNSWLITLDLSIMALILYGIVRLSGVLFVASSEFFQIDRQTASLPYILCDAVQTTVGPLAGYLGRRFGVQLVIIIGCLLSAAGIGFCYVAQNIITIVYLWGLLYGFGLGFSTLLLPVVITHHFNKKRATAIGILNFGSYIGLCTLPGLIEYIIYAYGLPGTFLWMSGITLQCVPLAMLLISPRFKENKSTSTHSSDPKDATSISLKLPCNDKLVYGTNVKPYYLEYDRPKSTYCCNKRIAYSYSISKSKVNGRDSYSCSNASRICKDSCASNSDKIPTKVIEMKSKDEMPERNHLSRPISTDHVNDQISRTKATHNTPINETNLNLQNWRGKQNDLNTFSVFLEPIYIMIMVTAAVYGSTFIAFVTVINDFCIDIGLNTEDAKYILMAFSLFSNIGLLSLGWVTDGGYISLTNFTGLLFMFRAASFILVPFCNSLHWLLVVSSVYGFFGASMSNMWSLMVADYYVDEVHEIGISSTLVITGPLYMAIPLAIGFFRDNLGSYDLLFYTMGAMSLVCGIAYFSVPVIERLRCGRDDSILRQR